MENRKLIMLIRLLPKQLKFVGFDEPIRGLHSIDSLHLPYALRNLPMRKDKVVIVVHYNPVVEEGVDHMVELGLGAGDIIYEEKPREIQWQTQTSKATTSKDNVFPRWIELHDSSLDRVKVVAKLKRSLNVAVTTGLKDVMRGSRVASLPTKQRWVARMLACNENELHDATVVVRVPSEQVSLRIDQVLNSIRKSSNMHWIFKLHGLK